MPSIITLPPVRQLSADSAVWARAYGVSARTEPNEE